MANPSGYRLQFELFFLFMAIEFIDHIIEISLHDLFEAIKSQIDAMIGQSALREIVSANFGGAVAGRDHGTPLSGDLGPLLFHMHVIESRPQHFQGLGLVLVLRLFVTRTAESVVLTDCPPGPDDRYTSMRKSFSAISMSTSSASGNTATVIAEV